MSDFMWQRMDGAARNAAPALMTVMLVLIGVTPLYLPAYGAVAPVLPLIAIYYWGVHRPDLLPFSLTFGIGLLQDVVTAAPLGLSALVFLLVRGILIGPRRFLVGRSFPVLWWGFNIVAVIATAIEWVVFAVYATEPVPFRPVAFRALTTMALFPAVAWIAIQVHRGFLKQR